MSLLVWLPLHGNLNNYGMSPAKFSITTGNNITVASNGKTSSSSYQRSTIATAGYVNSDTNFYFPQDFSMACWCKVNTVANTSTANGIITNHDHTTGGAGISLKVKDASTCYMSCNTGVGESARTYHTHYGTTNIFGAWHHLALTYDRSTTTYILYVDGKVEKTFTYGDTPAPRPFQLFNWSTSYDSTNYRPAIQLNDVRLWDECVSPKEIKEISQGLIAHYPLRDPYIESTTNLCGYPTPGASATNSYGWDKTLHKYAIAVSNWSVGYNSGVSTNGVKNPEIGYHAHWQLIDGTPIMVFPNINSLHSCSKRWLGISSAKTITFPSATTTYTISFDSKGTSPNAYTNVGLYYYNTSGTRNFHDGYVYGYGTDDWTHHSATFTTTNLDTTAAINVYCYGHNGAEGTMYVKNVQLEIKNHSTPYAIGTRNNTGSIIQDNSGYGHNLSIVGTGEIPVVYDSARNQQCTRILAGVSTYFSDSSVGMPQDAVTLSCWFKSDTNAVGTGNYHIPLAVGSEKYEFSIQGVEGLFRNGFVINGTRYAETISNSPKLNDGKWHLLTATYDGTNIKRYVDGALLKTAAVSGTLSGGNLQLCLGHYGTSTTYGNINSYMSDVRIYCTALNADDILKLYKDSAHIDNTYKFHCYELNEDAGKNSVEANGALSSTSFSEMAELHNMKIKHLDDGSAWARILWHDVTIEPTWFTTTTAQDCDDYNRYSKMYLVDKFISNKVTLTNMIPRPTASNTGFAATAAADTKVLYPGGVSLKLTGTTTAEITAASTFTAHYVPGHIFYARYNIYQETKVGGSQCYWKIAEPSMGGSQPVAAVKQWTPISFYRGGSNWEEGDYPFRIDFDNGKTAGVMWFDGLMLIDLTNAFGAGKEPSKAWCDTNIPFFTGTTTISAPGITTGKYEFMLTYPKISSTLYNRWRQTSSPNASTVTDYEPITIAWTNHSAGIRKQGSSSVWNCDSGSTWYAALGQIAGWTSSGLTNQIPAANNSPTTETELWVRIDNLAPIEKTNIYNDMFTSNNFIEI